MRVAIPDFDCKPGCHDCCGLVPFSRSERDRAIKRFPLEQWEPFVDGSFVPVGSLSTFTCVFLGKAGCKIYDIRPAICRLFGAVDEPRMTCPHGCGPASKISEIESREILECTA